LATVASMLGIRRFYARLHYLEEEVDPQAGTDRLQFGIRHLLIATTVAAVLATIGKTLSEVFHVPGAPANKDALALLFLSAVLDQRRILSIAATAVWACLGLAPPGQRLILLAVVLFGVIFLPTLFFRSTR